MPDGMRSLALIEPPNRSHSRRLRELPATPVASTEALKLAVDAEVALLVRLTDASSETMDVVHVSGAPLLALGASLPASTTRCIPFDGRGHRLRPERSLLEQLLATCGLRTACGFVLPLEGPPRGALLLAWDHDLPTVVAAREHVEHYAPTLVRAMQARTLRPGALVCHEDRLKGAGIAYFLDRTLGLPGQPVDSLEEAVAAVHLDTPDVILCSDRLGGHAPMPFVAQQLRAAGSAAHLVVLAGKPGPRGLRHALDAGAVGYLPVQQAADELPAAMANVLAGRTAFPNLGFTSDPPALTEREMDVLTRMELGLSDKAIASELVVAISTVKTHARAIYDKLNTPSRAAAVHQARLVGLLE